MRSTHGSLYRKPVTSRRASLLHLERYSQPREIRLICIFAGLFLLGTACLMDRASGGGLLGGILISIGTGGLIRCGVVAGHRRAYLRNEALRTERRNRLKEQRREREEQRKQLEIASRERQEQAEIYRRNERFRQAQDKAAREEAWRSTRRSKDSVLDRAAQQLQSASDAELIDRAVAALRRRGWEAVGLDDEAPFDFALKSLDGRLQTAVARCVPQDRVAESADIAEIDAWRQSRGADTAFLISTRGFGEYAVLDLKRRNLPVTLVEAHLLAVWLTD